MSKSKLSLVVGGQVGPTSKSWVTPRLLELEETSTKPNPSPYEGADPTTGVPNVTTGS